MRLIVMFFVLMTGCAAHTIESNGRADNIPTMRLATSTSPCRSIRVLKEGTTVWTDPWHPGDVKRWYSDPPSECVEP